MDTDIPSLINQLLLLFSLLFLSALFSFSETAITSMGKGKLMALQERHPKHRGIFKCHTTDNLTSIPFKNILNLRCHIIGSAI